MSQSPLQAKRLCRERPWQEHATLYRDLFADPRVAAGLWPGAPGGARTSAQASELLAADIVHWQERSFGPWVFFETATGMFVGRGGLRVATVMGGECVEVLYAVRSDAWGKGYATEMARLAVTHARALGLANVVGFAEISNGASQRVLEKAGMRWGAIFERAGLPHRLGRLRPIVYSGQTMLFTRKPAGMVDEASSLAGRATELTVPATHEVLGTPLKGPFPSGVQTAIFGMGCFWGAEQIFWQADGVYTTAVGYAGGFTPNPTYEEVCSGHTGHTEAVLVAFDTAATTYEEMLKLFWEGHDPTQGMRQGNDVGTQYRSAILWRDDAQRTAAQASRDAYQERLKQAGHGDVTTEIAEASAFYYAEGYHQQYLAKNPGGYCGLGGTGVSCPVGLTHQP
jgi:peptide-methionine (S)-S-oxide reductase